MKKYLKPLGSFFITMLLLLVGGFGLGLMAGHVSAYLGKIDSPQALAMSVLVLIAFFAGAVFLLVKGYAKAKSVFVSMISAEGEGDSPLADLIFGDFNDPKQKSIVIRMMVASALHGGCLMLLLSGGANVLELFEANTFVRVLVYVALIFSCAWLFFEGRNMIRSDPFWVDCFAAPTALAGLLLAACLVIYGAGVKQFGFPAVGVMEYYGFFLIAWMVLFFVKAVDLTGGE